MMPPHKALGRGLDALFTSTKARTAVPAQPQEQKPVPAASANEIRDVAVSKIKPNRYQPRTEFEPAALQELSESIKRHGLAQPLVITETVVAGEYELVAGERRLRASKLAGLATVPCVVKKFTNRERFEVALVENLQRQDLNALEEAVALDGLMKEYNLTQEEVAGAIGKSRSTVANILRFLRLHDDVQAALRGGTISEGHAKILAGVSEHSEQLRLLQRIVGDQLTVRQLEALLGTGIKKKSAKAAKPPAPEVAKFEEELQRLTGRRVEIQTNGKNGWLKFEFYTPEDLDYLCKKLGLKA